MMFDDNYAIPAGVAIYSLLENSDKNHNYLLFIMHNNITEKHINKLNIIVEKFSNAKLEFIQMNNYLKDFDMQYYPAEVLYKFFVPEVFVQYKTAIITDVDVVFKGDISKEYIDFLNDTENYFAGVKQAQYPIHPNFSRNIQDNNSHSIVGAGYMIYNLQKMREDKIPEKCLEYYKKYQVYCIYPEQDVINQICYPKIKLLHPKSMTLTSWYKYKNYMHSFYYCATVKEIEEAIQNPVQLHYVISPYGEYLKPWQYPFAPKADVWWEYICKTPFYDEAFDNFKNSIIKKEKLNFIQTIFSIKNSQDKKHKIITILGIKIKIKRKNK